MKKITYIIDGLGLGGAERIVYELATGLDKKRFDVEVVFLTPPKYLKTESQKADIRTLLEKKDILVTHIPKRSKIGCQLLRDLTNHLHTRKPDIVHTHLFASDLWGTIAAHRAKIKTILSTEHSLNQNEGKLKHLLKSFAARYTSSIIAVSETVAFSLYKRSPHAKKKVAVIPNGIDISRFSQKTQKEQRAARPFLVIGLFGRLEKEKGHADFLRTLALLSSKNSANQSCGNDSYRVRIVGNGTQKKYLESLVQELHLTEQVTFEPARDDIAALYQEVDILAVPSRFEGFGLVAVEGMAAGLPIIASDIPAFREIVQSGKNGFLVDFVSHKKEAAQRIDELLSDKELRDRVGKSASSFAQKYDLQVMIEEYENVYDRFYEKDRKRGK